MRRAVGLATVAALLLGACARGGGPQGGIADAPVEAPSPAPGDVGDSCADVHDARVCWGAGGGRRDCSEGVCRVPRPLPATAHPFVAWRCSGHGSRRTCRDLGRRAWPFRCRGGLCVQAHPRLPDDADWECVERAGAVLCRGGQPAAGIVPGPPDTGWHCGARRGGADGERVCVDLAPDYPSADSTAWSCSFDTARGLERRCSAVSARDRAASLASPCSAPHACPAGTVCTGRLCLPRRPAPACWVDADCGATSVCVIGTCSAGAA